MLWSENKLALFTLYYRFRYDHILRMAMDSLSIQVAGLNTHILNAKLIFKNLMNLAKAMMMRVWSQS